MKTHHLIYLEDSAKMSNIKTESIQMVITSPPYPMIEMWDNMFSRKNPDIKTALLNEQGIKAFELMHKKLDKVWKQVYRVLEYGSFACINIGDATRKIGNDFLLYPNHARIISYMTKIGFSPMPCIIWRKQTNAPNKFMGSGTLPSGAYVTLEHEYILIFRKGHKREFINDKDKQKRRESSFFWEERNQWFSDIWFDLKGTVQNLTKKETRQRSAAFPFALPYRLINMYSVKGDTILDPFFGLGTTMLAAMTGARNSIGFEIETELIDCSIARTKKVFPKLNKEISKRLDNHIEFVKNRENQKKKLKHFNSIYKFNVVTKQEKFLFFNKLKNIKFNDLKKEFNVSYFNAQNSFFEKEKNTL